MVESQVVALGGMKFTSRVGWSGQRVTFWRVTLGCLLACLHCQINFRISYEYCQLLITAARQRMLLKCLIDDSVKLKVILCDGGKLAQVMNEIQ